MRMLRNAIAFACMRVYVCVCICACVYACIRACVHEYLHVCVCVCMCVDMPARFLVVLATTYC